LRYLSVIALSVVATSAFAVDIIAANQYAATPFAPANGLNTFIRDLGQARTGQLIIGSQQLTGMNVGDTITGMTFRLWNGSTTQTWTGHNYADYEIRIGEGVAPNLASTTLASNFTGTPTLVNDGATTLSGFSSGNTGATPNAWGNVIAFQSGYVYTGGNLTIEVRHTGGDAVFPNLTFAEAVASTGTGYGTEYTSVTATGNLATTGALAAFTMVKLSVTPVPEPATFVALGLGAAALLRRRRKANA
jgi:hypothetical protein